jgi:heat shock protein HslJ
MPPNRLPAMVGAPVFRILVAAILVVGCGESTSSPVDVSGVWQLTGGTVDGAPFPVVPDAPVTLSVAGSEIGGRSPCNHYGGRIVVDGGGSRFEMTSMTAMACEQPVMAAEAVFVAALPRIRGATLDGDRLILAGTGVELTFDRLPPVPVADMVSRDWVLESLISGDMASSPAGEPATLRLEASGTIGGSTGCRTFRGRWVLANGGVMPTDFGMDQTECPPQLAEQDSHVVGVLEGFRVSVDGQQLTLAGDRGRGLIYRAD